MLQKSVTQVNTHYKKEHPNDSVSTLCRLRPKNVKIEKHRSLIQCLWEYCENVNLKLKAFNTLVIKVNNQYTYEAVDLTLCDRNGETFHNFQCIEGNCMKCGTATLRRKIQPVLTNEELRLTRLDYVSVPNHKTGKETRYTLVHKD